MTSPNFMVIGLQIGKLHRGGGRIPSPLAVLDCKKLGLFRVKSGFRRMNPRQYTKFNQLMLDIFKICSLQTCSIIQGKQITMESAFINKFTMNNIAPKLQKCWTHKIAFNIIKKMVKQPSFFYNHKIVQETALNHTLGRPESPSM